VKRIFTLSEEDWKALMDASRVARSTPVILISGRDASADAHRSVMVLWDELGERYGFIPSTVEPGYEPEHQIQAEPVPDRLAQIIERHDRAAS